MCDSQQSHQPRAAPAAGATPPPAPYRHSPAGAALSPGSGPARRQCSPKRQASPEFALSHRTLYPIQQSAPSVGRDPGLEGELRQLREQLQALSGAQSQTAQRQGLLESTVAGGSMRCDCGCVQRIAQLRTDVAQLRGWCDGLQQRLLEDMAAMRGELAQTQRIPPPPAPPPAPPPPPEPQLPPELAEQIAALADSAAAIQREIEELRAEMGRSGEKYGQLQRELAARPDPAPQVSAQEVEGLRDSVEQMRAHAADQEAVRRELDGLRAELAQLRDQMQQSSRRSSVGNSALQQEVVQLRQEVAQLREAQQQQRAAFDSELEALRRQLQRLEDQQGEQAAALAERPPPPPPQPSADDGAALRAVRDLEARLESLAQEVHGKLADHARADERLQQEINSLRDDIRQMQSEVQAAAQRPPAAGAGDGERTLQQVQDVEARLEEAQVALDDCKALGSRVDNAERVCGELQGFLETTAKNLDELDRKTETRFGEFDSKLQTDLMPKVRRLMQITQAKEDMLASAREDAQGGDADADT